jgi:hypothetical protein
MTKNVIYLRAKMGAISFITSANPGLGPLGGEVYSYPKV